VLFRSVAKLIGKDYKNTHNIVMRLKKMKLIRIEKFGNSSRIVLKKIANPLMYESEYVRRIDIMKNKNISVINDYFMKMKSIFYVLLLFGSYASKTNTKHSDIDLFFIVPNETREFMEKEIYDVAALIPLDLHINIFSESEFKDMNLSKILTVGSEAINNNIILHGIEYYYEMIS